jgi:hypothetical protein
MKNDIPIACSLTSAELRQREATLLAQFKSAVIETEELPDGYAFRISSESKWTAVVADMIAAERQCCPFLAFELVAQPETGPVILRVTGPAGGKQFVKAILCPP